MNESTPYLSIHLCHRSQAFASRPHAHGIPREAVAAPKDRGGGAGVAVFVVSSTWDGWLECRVGSQWVLSLVSGLALEFLWGEGERVGVELIVGVSVGEGVGGERACAMEARTALSRRGCERTSCEIELKKQSCHPLSSEHRWRMFSTRKEVEILVIFPSHLEDFPSEWRKQVDGRFHRNCSAASRPCEVDRRKYASPFPRSVTLGVVQGFGDQSMTL